MARAMSPRTPESDTQIGIDKRPALLYRSYAMAVSTNNGKLYRRPDKRARDKWRIAGGPAIATTHASTVKVERKEAARLGIAKAQRQIQSGNRKNMKLDCKVKPIR